MASKKVDCDRCSMKTRAAQTVRFSYLGRDYELELCAQHVVMFDRDMGGWTRLAREIEKPAPFAGKSAYSRELENERAARFVADRAARKSMTPPPDGTVVVLKRPATYDFWKITAHARERMEERGVTEEQVRWCAAAPHLSVPTHISPGEWYYRRDGVQLVVAPESRTVITVMDESMRGQRKVKSDASSH